MPSSPGPEEAPVKILDQPYAGTDPRLPLPSGRHAQQKPSSCHCGGLGGSAVDLGGLGQGMGGGEEDWKGWGSSRRRDHLSISDLS